MTCPGGTRPDASERRGTKPMRLPGLATARACLRPCGATSRPIRRPMHDGGTGRSRARGRCTRPAASHRRPAGPPRRFGTIAAQGPDATGAASGTAPHASPGDPPCGESPTARTRALGRACCRLPPDTGAVRERRLMPGRRCARTGSVRSRERDPPRKGPSACIRRPSPLRNTAPLAQGLRAAPRSLACLSALSRAMEMLAKISPLINSKSAERGKFLLIESLVPHNSSLRYPRNSPQTPCGERGRTGP